MRKTDEAIRLIETIPPESRGVALTIEYGIAHHFAGDHQAAKKIYESALKMSNCKALLTALSLNLLATWARTVTDPAQRWRYFQKTKIA